MLKDHDEAAFIDFLSCLQMRSKKGSYWDMGTGKYGSSAFCIPFAISTELVLSGNDRWDVVSAVK